MYGYKIINGKAVIDEQEAGAIVSIFNGYLSGLSMKAAAENAGVPMPHGSVKRILSQDIYTGTDYYPAIISRETFEAVQEERKRRSNMVTDETGTHRKETRYSAKRDSKGKS